MKETLIAHQICKLYSALCTPFSQMSAGFIKSRVLLFSCTILGGTCFWCLVINRLRSGCQATAGWRCASASYQFASVTALQLRRRRRQCGAMSLAGYLSCEFGVEDTPKWVDASGFHGTEWQTLLGDPELLCNEAVLRVSRGRGPGISTIHAIKKSLIPTNRHRKHDVQ